MQPKLTETQKADGWTDRRILNKAFQVPFANLSWPEICYGPNLQYILPNAPVPYIAQCTIQNRNVHISVLKGVLCDVKQVHCGICEIGPDERLDHQWLLPAKLNIFFSKRRWLP